MPSLKSSSIMTKGIKRLVSIAVQILILLAVIVGVALYNDTNSRDAHPLIVLLPRQPTLLRTRTVIHWTCAKFLLGSEGQVM
ncbi:MAG: hypothetical protein HLX46_14475 [Corynebacterium sp.]|uniref:hypothetical protein n=1 Tax=Corynebacterium sp. TaxID=1720 RepID=UPI00184F9826|nr:hypothetical protein [Corynebacterium sp.]NWO17978.1 hypothetical protein [Corynebacterium sp.]